MNRYKTLIIFLLILTIFTIQKTNISGLPTIDPTRECSIIINKYAVDTINDYSTPAVGEQQTINDLVPLANISFIVTRVQDTDTSANSATPLQGDQEYSQTITTDASGLASFTDLKQGIYLVQEMDSPAVTSPVDDFLVSLPMTNPMGTSWLYDVYVYPKNQLAANPLLEMFIQQPGTLAYSSNPGRSNTWVSTTEVPNDIATCQTYQLDYELNTYLPYVFDTTQVYTIDSNDNEISLVSEDDFSLDVSATNLVVTLLENGKTKLHDVLDTDFTPLLYVTFDTTLEIPPEDLSDVLSTKLAHTKIFTYTNSLGVTYSLSVDKLDSAYVYTGGFSISKINSQNDEPLANAYFKLYPTLEDANAGTNAIQTPTGTGDWEVITDVFGKANFYGLAYGQAGSTMEDASSFYYLVETKAPDNFNLLKSPIKVTVDQSSHLVGNEITISNSTGFTLPITGGTGTLIFSVLGISLIGGAIYLYLRSRNSSNQ